ncbi:MAG: 2-oxo acid dehydrogenase subunit E2 [Chloroflexi bacterium]|nr:2-oxo acid dehydrogenase subunit E2 [Chloroflexota bacterium]
MGTLVTMPVLGLTMESGTIVEWLKAEGELVTKDEPLFTVETDKAVVEAPAPASGILRAIFVPAGGSAPVRAPIAEIVAPEEVSAQPADPAPASPEAASGAAPPLPAAGAPVVTPASDPTAPAAERAPPAVSPAAPSRRFASPRARLRAREHGVDLATVVGSGQGGRILERDVLAAAAQLAPRATPLAQRVAAERGIPLSGVAGSGPAGQVRRADVETLSALAGDLVPLSRQRRATAERMAASARAVARVTLFAEVMFEEAARLRAQLAAEFARRGIPGLPWDALIVRAVALALREHPALNASWVEGAGIRHSAAINVGVAVALAPEGLVVPVVHAADHLPLRETARELLALVERARSGRLTIADLSGGTFTVSNLGARRILAFTPIVNPPETAILGVGQIAPRPAVREGQLVICPTGILSLSFDHRVVDGEPAAAFLERVVELLERPYALLDL